jgi:hypothetical protein
MSEVQGGIEVVLTVYPSFVCTRKMSVMRLINERKGYLLWYRQYAAIANTGNWKNTSKKMLNTSPNVSNYKEGTNHHLQRPEPVEIPGAAC